MVNPTVSVGIVLAYLLVMRKNLQTKNKLVNNVLNNTFNDLNAKNVSLKENNVPSHHDVDDGKEKGHFPVKPNNK